MSIDPLFTHFEPALSKQGSNYSLPERFTYPFYYEPHPLSVMASTQLQQTLQANPDFSSFTRGKMFGVLVVKNTQGELGFLSAFSGKINDSNHHQGFVPPVYDMLEEGSFYRGELDEVTQISNEIKAFESKSNIDVLKQQFAQISSDATQQITQLQAEIAESRKERKQQRMHGQQTLYSADFSALEADLAKQSVAQKNQLKWLKKEWADKQDIVKHQIQEIETAHSELRQRRATRSNQLQHKVFAHYAFLNANAERQDLNQIFANTAYKVPPAGAGECAAPKLLQYAYLNQYTPIVLAEFWWGPSPKSEIRKHQQFYPSCMSKCHPILSHMLQGLEVDPNPLLENPAKDKPLPIVYEDEHIVVVNKPEGFLSVPGRHIQDSAFHRIIQMYPDAEGPFVLHRLDMATSGLLVFALTKRANKHLQKQFISREVKKRYVALIDGELTQNEGQIALPLCGDPYDRPRQMVCYEQGKPSLTHYQLIEVIDGKTKLFLYPETGRTHQLRVHCAHKDGLNMPMIGDTLYGNKDVRLFLHAQQLSFSHPITQQWMTFETDIPF
ncbi:RNA pseudouridine synthase [Vibrio sp. UCD-FRSSP16_10]|uniref:RluA family pseudouridine synthase n=1 Tax=unclassified Vibrio TaxID=2614977 RepID=UPI0007FC05D8|nr:MULTISPECIES: pseudouridine synthase [unclassified Vibrio]OBT13386.1 RNA pseudouridine synthase [Vibrio sp. UCD-FRSSP16_10]OBT17896.1 RNA pseudouridine synthase [Vibrio sp. UCD-FRSSP16_30]